MSTATLRQIERQDQAELAARHNGENRRVYRSRWVIDTLANRLPTEHVHLARRIHALQAVSEGRKPQDYDRVDGAGNGTETALLSRIDAASKIAGYEGAVFATPLRRGGVLCLRAIAEGDTFSDTIRRCGYAAGSDRSVRELVQLTMFAAQDYEDRCALELEHWRAM